MGHALGGGFIRSIFSPPPRRPPFECLPSVSRRDADLKILCIMPSSGLGSNDSGTQGDQLANEQAKDYRLRFAVALPRTAETRVDFSLGSQARRVLIALCRPRRKPPPLKTPLVNPCNPTPRWPQWSAKTHSHGPN